MQPIDRPADIESEARDERLVEFVRHFRSCEDMQIATGQRLHELADSVLANDGQAHRLAREALAFLADQQGERSTVENDDLQG